VYPGEAPLQAKPADRGRPASGLKANRSLDFRSVVLPSMRWCFRVGSDLLMRMAHIHGAPVERLRVCFFLPFREGEAATIGCQRPRCGRDGCDWRWDDADGGEARGLRRPVLYPTELRARVVGSASEHAVYLIRPLRRAHLAGGSIVSDLGTDWAREASNFCIDSTRPMLDACREVLVCPNVRMSQPLLDVVEGPPRLRASGNDAREML
jgi:hypothetical protein